MDLAEKRKQLEAVRAARQAKQQVVEQYMTGRSSNTSYASSFSAASPAPALAAAAVGPPPTRGFVPSPRPFSTAPSTQSSPRANPNQTTTEGACRPIKRGSFFFPDGTGATGGPLTPPPPSSTSTSGAVLEECSETPRATTTATAAAKGEFCATSPRPLTPSSTAAVTRKIPASSLCSQATPGAVTPLIQVFGVGTPDVAADAGGAVDCAKRAETGGDVAKGRFAPKPTITPFAAGGIVNSAAASAGTSKPVAAVGAATSNSTKRTSPVRGGAADKAQSPTEAVHVDARAGTRGGGWSSLLYCMRNGSNTLGHDLVNETPTHPVCVFNPAVVLGDVTGPADSSCRRVILDATSCLVPYEGAAVASAWRGSTCEGNGESTVWSVCVAATYGQKGASLLGGTCPATVVVATDGVGGSGQRYSGMENSTLTTELHSGRGGWSAEAALAGVRASMGCGYPWGSASAAAVQTTVPGNTMDAALRVALESPGLVLTWFTVPLPPNSLPRKEGTLYADTSSSNDRLSAGHTGMDADDATNTPGFAGASADYVVIVVPLVCDSEVTTVLAHPFQPSTLLGGTRCGRLVQWSMGQAWAQVEPRRLIERAFATTGTATTLLLPPQRPTHSSFPSPQAHQTPVLRLAIHGDVSCHHLYSISQEGKVCTWSAWQPLHPTASCLSYLGIRPMGNIGVAARFVERPGTDAMTQVFIGTTSGAVLVGTNRDAKSVELQYYGPPRPLPTSSTVIRTLDVTASSLAAATVTATTEAAGGAAEAASSRMNSVSMASSIGLGARNPTSTPAGGESATTTAAAAMGSCAASHRTASASSSYTPIQLPQPQQQDFSTLLMPTQLPLLHRGRIVSMSLQTATQGFRGQDCVISAATDGTCAAWFARTAVPLEGFSSAVTSVCWSPTKPGVLAAGDASGLVTVWAVNMSIITPVGTVSLREASRRVRGSTTSDAVLWIVAGPSDAAGVGGGGAGGSGSGGFFGRGAEEDDGGADASLGQADAVGAAVSSVFFSCDGRWLFASTACGYVYAMRVGASLA